MPALPPHSSSTPTPGNSVQTTPQRFLCTACHYATRAHAALLIHSTACHYVPFPPHTARVCHQLPSETFRPPPGGLSLCLAEHFRKAVFRPTVGQPSQDTAHGSPTGVNRKEDHRQGSGRTSIAPHQDFEDVPSGSCPAALSKLYSLYRTSTWPPCHSPDRVTQALPHHTGPFRADQDLDPAPSHACCAWDLPRKVQVYARGPLKACRLFTGLQLWTDVRLLSKPLQETCYLLLHPGQYCMHRST